MGLRVILDVVLDIRSERAQTGHDSNQSVHQGFCVVLLRSLMLESSVPYRIERMETSRIGVQCHRLFKYGAAASTITVPMVASALAISGRDASS